MDQEDWVIINVKRLCMSQCLCQSLHNTTVNNNRPRHNTVISKNLQVIMTKAGINLSCKWSNNATVLCDIQRNFTWHLSEEGKIWGISGSYWYWREDRAAIGKKEHEQKFCGKGKRAIPRDWKKGSVDAAKKHGKSGVRGSYRGNMGQTQEDLVGYV